MRINKIAPGIPKIPTVNAVPIFNPIWKEKALPIKLMIVINIPPKIEFSAIFPIIFKGT